MAASKQISHEVEDFDYGGLIVQYWYSQTFTTSSAFDMSSVYMRFFVNGSPPDTTVSIGLYAVDGSHKPTGVALDSTSASISAGWFQFLLTYSLSASTEYAIVCSFTGGDFPPTWSFGLQGDTAKGYTDGYGWISSDGSNWSDIGADLNFQVWGEAAVPSKPINPTPSDTATGIKKSLAQVSWEDGGGATSYDVYFGPTGNMTLRSSGQAGLTWSVEDTLDYNTEYSWRIDAVNDNGTTTGDVWTFTTEAFDPPELDSVATIKRLVVASNNAIFYES